VTRSALNPTSQLVGPPVLNEIDKAIWKDRLETVVGSWILVALFWILFFLFW